MILKGKNGKNYQLTVGLEVHAQLNSNSKLFSSARNSFAQKPNSNISFFDIASPGQLPVLNKAALFKAIATGIALNGKINKISRFDRKHYFYPDLTLGYQITQFYKPIIEDAFIDINTENGEVKRINIERIHLEQDAGKMIHDSHSNQSLLDYNRAGVALIEIVTKPDFTNIDQVITYLKNLQSILRFTGSCDADLEKGTFRCDANVSISEFNSNTLGTRCEIKNINSFKFIAQAIEYEAKRHLEIIESGLEVKQETRLFNNQKTESMREKVDAIDYRYFPDPDLLPVIISDKEIEEIKNSLPELPVKKQERYKKLGLSNKEISLLCSDPIYANYFDEINKVKDTKLCLTWMLTELLGKLNSLEIPFEQNKVATKDLIDLMTAIENQVISGKIAKDILEKIIKTNKSVFEIIEEEGLRQIDDSDYISKMLDKIIEQNLTQFKQLKDGNQKLFAFFIGQVMKLSDGKAKPEIVNNLIKQRLATQ
jgi:aspartyl-tRNA(Asn)/glutamyl-tRNA(Gln) amidotransferase subunit B